MGDGTGSCGDGSKPSKVEARADEAYLLRKHLAAALATCGATFRMYSACGHPHESWPLKAASALALLYVTEADVSAMLRLWHTMPVVEVKTGRRWKP